KVTGIVLSLYESSTRLAQEVIDDLQDYLDKSRNSNAPWAKARIFATRVRRNIKLAECPSFGQSIFAYARSCNGAEDYAALVREVVRAVLAGEDVADYELSLAFVDNPTIHRLNQRYLQHDEPTDVLSFPLGDPKAAKLSGELVIGAEVAQAQAAERGHDA